MKWLQNVMYVLGRIVTIEERLGDVNDRLLKLAEKYDDLNQRLARLEGKFELLESMGAAGRRRLPPGS